MKTKSVGTVVEDAAQPLTKTVNKLITRNVGKIGFFITGSVLKKYSRHYPIKYTFILRQLMDSLLKKCLTQPKKSIVLNK